MHYDGFSSSDCTGTVVETHDEHPRQHCDRRYSEKCIEPGFLVRSTSLNGDIGRVKATPIDRCVKTSDGTAAMTDFRKMPGGGFSYKWKEWVFTAGMWCMGTPVNDTWHSVPGHEEDSEMMGGDHYMHDYWHAKDKEDALNLDLFKVRGNRAWNDWYTLDTYGNDMCEGEPMAIYAGKQFCTGGHTNMCTSDGMLKQQKYTEPECINTDGGSMDFGKDECKSIGDGKWQKARCHMRGQEYMKEPPPSTN